MPIPSVDEPVEPVLAAARPGSRSKQQGLIRLVSGRLIAAVAILFLVSVLVFAATQVLPGNAATAVLGHSATPDRIDVLEEQLHLNDGVVEQYWAWLSGMLTGDPGTSLASGLPVWSEVKPRLINSAVLVAVAGTLGCLIGLGLGVVTALRKDGWLDHGSAVAALAVAAIPEFVVAIALVMLFATVVMQVLPAISYLPPGTYAWEELRMLVLPVLTLVIVVVPYVQRMTRAAMVEVLESDYVEMARLKGAPPWRIVFVHALPNALAPIIQVIGLTFLYLAGGIVVVEFVFNFPGIGAGLIEAVSNRDIPIVQFAVVALAAFYVSMNILTDVVAIASTPRRRLPRQ
jgi:peptide/nickel transport system permease protein